MTPRRIGFVHSVALIGGAERSLLILLRHLDRTRETPVLLCPPGPLADEARTLGIEVRPWCGGRAHRRGWAGLGTAARAALAATHLALRAGDLDLLHANSPLAALAALPWRAVTGRPLVWHVRDLRLPPGLVCLLAPRVSCALAISRAVADELRRAGLAPDRLALLPNVLDPDDQPVVAPATARAELGLRGDDEVLLAVGQVVPWKGWDVLLAAAAQLAPRRPRLRLVLAGADRWGEHPAFAAQLRARAASPPLAGHVVWVGWSARVPALLAAADLLVLPSRGEPFGRVLLEAMAARRPVVATTGGPSDVVRPGVTGWLVPPGDPAALAAALDRALALPPATRAALGERAHRTLIAGFAPDLQRMRMAAIYDKVLGSASG